MERREFIKAAPVAAAGVLVGTVGAKKYHPEELTEDDIAIDQSERYHGPLLVPLILTLYDARDTADAFVVGHDCPGRYCPEADVQAIDHVLGMFIASLQTAMGGPNEVLRAREQLSERRAEARRRRLECEEPASAK